LTVKPRLTVERHLCWTDIRCELMPSKVYGLDSERNV